MERTTRFFLPLPFVLALILGVGCEADSPSSQPPFSGRVLLIGIDGASDRVLGPMMRAGRLPNLSRIANDGVYGPILSSYPLLSPRIWTTVATGKHSDKHGIRSWTRATRDGDLQRLNYSYDRKTHALWNILSSHGKTVGVVNWLTTYPPEVVRGVMVSSHTFPAEVGGKVFLGNLFAGQNGKQLEPVKRGDARGPIVFPIEWTDRVLDERHQSATLTQVANAFLASDAITIRGLTPEQMAGGYDHDEQLVSVTREIQQEKHPDLVMLLLQGIDRMSHLLWAGVEDPRAYPPETRWTPEQFAAGRVAVETYYQFTDALIGVLLEDVGPDDLVIVMSDHGFEAPQVSKKLLTGEHYSDAARDGVFFARGRDIRAGGGTQGITMNDVTPTVLTWLGIPIGDDMDGQPAAFLETTPKPSIPTHDTTAIRRLAGASGSDEAILKQLKQLGYIE